MAKAITAANRRPIGIISADRKNTVPGQSKTSMRTSKPTTADRIPETRPRAAMVRAGWSRQDLSEGTGVFQSLREPSGRAQETSPVNEASERAQRTRQCDGAR